MGWSGSLWLIVACCGALLTQFLTHLHPARALVCIAGAERRPVRHLAPLAGVWGLAPTLPNTTDHRSIAGSVPTGSRVHLPLVISPLPGSLSTWNSPASAVELGVCVVEET